jgi:hypothetical protein
MLASVAGAIAVFALLGYLAGIDTHYGSVSVNSPPLPTAVGLLCVAGGIILRKAHVRAGAASNSENPMSSILELAGRRALVTGATKRVGRAVALSSGISLGMPETAQAASGV